MVQHGRVRDTNGHRPMRLLALATSLAFATLVGCDGGDDEGAQPEPVSEGTEAAAPGPEGAENPSTAADDTTGARSNPPTQTRSEASKSGTGPAPAALPAVTGTDSPAPAGGEAEAAPAAETEAAASGTKSAQLRKSREIRIFPDEADEPPFDPRLTRVFPDTLIRWVNLDVVPRSVVAKSGKFKSPMIPPGGHFDYFADEYGFFEYIDGTRPTVTAAIHVV